MKISLSALSIISSTILAASPALGDNWPQWRGPDRDGISHESGLLKAWPQNGPKLLWTDHDIGRGYSTPAVVRDRLFVIANDGLQNEFVEALSVSDGKRIWSTRVGNSGNPNQQPNFPGARSTPTVVDDSLFALSSDGDLVRLDAQTGAIKWTKNVRSEFGGKTAEWAYAESPLVDGDAVVCAPGGSEATVIAVQKETGQLIWKCPLPEGDDAGFSSTIAVDAAGTREYVRLLTKGLVGIDAKSGQLLWRYSKPISKYGANIQTPLASDGLVFCSSTGTGAGAVRLKASGGRIDAEQVYFSPSLQTAIGGVVKVGDFLYGATGEALLCTDFATGATKWKERSLGPASLCYADGHLYLHGENGDVGLVEASPDSYREISRFTPPDPPARINPMEKAWAYPVVADGRLYIRDNNVLWCYDVAAARQPL